MPRLSSYSRFRTLFALTGIAVVAACGSSAPQNTPASAADAQAGDGASSSEVAADAVSTDTAAVLTDAAAVDTSPATDSSAKDASGDGASAGDNSDAAAISDAKTDAAADGGADAPTADASPPAPIALAELASATAAAICQANFTTCTPEDKMPFATQAGCVAATTATDAATFAKLATLVAAGKLAYDGTAAAACLALAVEHCDELDFVDGPPVCQTVFKGKATDGAACGFNVECASNFCFSKPNCPGACKKRVALAGSCGEDDKCVAGAICFGGLCVADVPKDVGAACDPVKCKPGLYCISKEKCAPLNKADAACDIVGSCAAGMQCIDSGNGGTCQPMPKKGEACTPDPFADASTQCAAGLVCVNDGGETGSCEPKVPIGGACVNSTQCGGSDVHCVGAKGQTTCQVLAGKGGPCQKANLDIGEWNGCLAPWTCSGGVCVDVPTLGQKCADDLLAACADDLMCDLVSNKCIAIPGNGEKCYGLCKTGFDCDMTKQPNTCKPLVCN